MATEIEILEARIKKLGVEPLRIRGDSGEFEQSSLTELRKQLQYLEEKATRSESGGGKIPGVRWGKVIPPGAQ